MGEIGVSLSDSSYSAAENWRFTVGRGGIEIGVDFLWNILFLFSVIVKMHFQMFKMAFVGVSFF